MTMREKIARALCIADGIDPDQIWRVRLGPASGGEPISDPWWVRYDGRAVAALEAIRKPTDAMEVAALDLGYDPASVDIWTAMIEAAIAGAPK